MITQSELPAGTVTFLFSDIEGSTTLWERHPAAMQVALARHDRALRRAIAGHHGHVVKTTGDGCHAVFASATDAVAAALAAQRALAETEPEPVEPTVVIRARMGLHTGEAELRDGDYYGSAVNRAARIMSIGHGGQVLLSAASAALLAAEPLPGATLRDLGEHRLRNLTHPERIFQLAAAGLPSDFPPLRSLDAFPGNLPVQLTPFVGRERELARVRELLAQTRLLTVTGPGGTGKTRLTLQAAAAVQTDYHHGVWLVELAPLTDPAHVLPAIAGVFALSPQPGVPPATALDDYVRGKRLLLILDNCEHLLAACAELAARLLVLAPGLKILASSREGLGVPGETTYHLPTLSLPEAADATAAAVARYDAVTLFVQRAQAARPDFALTDRDAPAVAQIVRRLDGIPLAIELAAARVRVLTPEQIAARLDDRFRLLTGGSRTALPRQQTLRALIDWSYTLLSPAEAAVFRRLGVFVGGWTLEAAEEVVADDPPDGGASVPREEVLDLLTGLVHKSLVLVDDSEDGARYGYLETIRQYARDRLFESGEGEAARERHLAYYDRAFLVPLEADKILSSGFPSLLVQAAAGRIENLDREIENLRAATEWATARNPERGLPMAAALALSRSMTRPGDGAPAVQAALDALEALPAAEGGAAEERVRLRLMARLALGHDAAIRGDAAHAVGYFGDAARLARAAGDDLLLARALVMRSLTAGFLGDTAALVDGEEAAALFRALDEPLGVAQALGQMAQFHLRRGETEQALPLARESLALSKGVGDPVGSSTHFLLAPYLALALGDVVEAEALFRAGIAEFRRLGIQSFAAITESEFAHTLRRLGRLEEARALYRRALPQWHNAGLRAAVANLLENIAFMERADGQPERAVRLLGAADQLRRAVEADMSPWERAEYDREVAALRAELSPEAFARVWDEGRSLSIDAAVEHALSG